MSLSSTDDREVEYQHVEYVEVKCGSQTLLMPRWLWEELVAWEQEGWSMDV